MPKTSLDGWYTVTQAAARKRVARQTLLRAIKEGRLVAVRVGQQWLIAADALADYQPNYDPASRLPSPQVAT